MTKDTRTSIALGLDAFILPKHVIYRILRRIMFSLLKIPAEIAPPFQQMGTAIPEIWYRCSSDNTTSV